MAAIVLAIIVATATGVWAELRLGGRAGSAARRALIFVLYVVLPPTTFFNLARVQSDADVGLGIGLGQRVVAFFTRNPPLYAAALALIAPDSLAPDVLVDASRIAIVALLPLGFFAVGAALAEESEEGTIPIPPSLDAAVAAAVGLRLVVAAGAPLPDRPAADRSPRPICCSPRCPAASTR